MADAQPRRAICVDHIDRVDEAGRGRQDEGAPEDYPRSGEEAISLRSDREQLEGFAEDVELELVPDLVTDNVESTWIAGKIQVPLPREAGQEPPPRK